MQKIDQTITQITVPTPFAVGDVHMYLLKGDTLSLIDAGVKTKEAWEAFAIQLKELGYRPLDIEQVILTHHHPDHIGLVDQLPRVNKIIAHQNVDAWLRREETFFHRYEQFFKELYIATGIPEKFHHLLKKLRDPLHFTSGGELTDVIHEGDVLPGHEDWSVIDTKGHAQSHLSFLREKDGMFIGGDHLLKNISPNPLLEPPYDEKREREKPILQYRDNLKKCLTLNIKQVLPGHGEIFSNVEEIIPVRLMRQEQRANKVLQLLKQISQNPFQICQQIFPKQYVKQLNLTMSETMGQLDYLEAEDLVKHSVEDGYLNYHAK